MQNPCSCHWLELTDFLSTSRSSRKDKEIWEISSLACYLEARWGVQTAPIETVAACPLCAGGITKTLWGFLLKMFSSFKGALFKDTLFLVAANSLAHTVVLSCHFSDTSRLSIMFFV